MKFGFHTQLHDPELKRGFSGVLQDLAEQLDLVYEMGFDGPWFGEHHLGPEGLSNTPNPLPICADVAAKYDFDCIGIAIIAAGTWHPIRLAEDLAILDHLTQGRLKIGFGRGTYSRDTVPFHPKSDPRDEAASREINTEVIDIILKAWTQDFFSHEGPNYKFPPDGIPHHPWSPTEVPYTDEKGFITGMCVLPKPLQEPYPTIYVAVSSETSARRAAENGWNCFVAGTAIHIINDWLQIYAEIRSEREGREFKPGECWAIQRPFYVAHTMEQARKDFEYYVYRQREYQALYRQDKARDYTKYTLGGADQWSWEVLLERAMIAGDPDTVGEKLQQLQDIGIRYLNCWTDVGGLPHEMAMRSLELFRDKVMPFFKDSPEDSLPQPMTR